MKKAKLQIERLMQFAEHLKSIKKPLDKLEGRVELVEFELQGKVKIRYHMRYNIAVLLEIPKAFPEDWFLKEPFHIPLLKGKTFEDGPVSCFALWFDLHPELICHLLDTEGYQQEQYGGVILNEDSMPADYAKNFEALANWSRNQQQVKK